MGSLVVSQGGGQGKLGVARLAFVRLLPGMPPHVKLQESLHCKSLIAVGTFQVFLFVLGFFVMPQRTPGAEFLVAVAADVFRLLGVGFLVPAVRGGIVEHAGAVRAHERTTLLTLDLSLPRRSLGQPRRFVRSGTCWVFIPILLRFDSFLFWSVLNWSDCTDFAL